MSNIDKQDKSVIRELIADARSRRLGKLIITADEMEALLDELEAAERRNTELTEALRQSVMGYKSCLRMGYDRILDLGGDCDSPEVMITGNPDIQQAEKLLAAAAGKGE